MSALRHKSNNRRNAPKIIECNHCKRRITNRQKKYLLTPNKRGEHVPKAQKVFVKYICDRCQHVRKAQGDNKEENRRQKIATIKRKIVIGCDISKLENADVDRIYKAVKDLNYSQEESHMAQMLQKLRRKYSKMELTDKEREAYINSLNEALSRKDRTPIAMKKLHGIVTATWKSTATSTFDREETAIMQSNLSNLVVQTTIEQKRESIVRKRRASI